jgi:hypothetical protein
MTATKEVRRAADWWLEEAVAADKARLVNPLAVLGEREARCWAWCWAIRAQRELAGDWPQEDTRRDRL